MAMDATTRPSSSFTVFKGPVDVHGLAVAPGKGWASVQCASKKAYGCGEHGQQLADGLTLYVRRAAHPDLTSSMSIGLSDEAAGSVEAELGLPRSCIEAEADIKVAHRQAIVLLLIFRHHCINRRCYYLVYDSTDASLCVIPYIPRELEATYTLAAVPMRGAGGAGLALALMARTHWPQYVDRGRLCVCAPAAAQANPGPGSTAGPWQATVHRFPNLRQPFSADVVFSCHRKVFWTDLSQGVAYSDLGAGGSAVDTVFIGLPEEYQIEYPYPLSSPTGPAKMSRTMGCVEDSIKFVCIDRRHGNEAVKVLTLDLDRQLWEEDEGLSCPWNDLWEQVQVGSMNAELRESELLEPQYPTLMPDGAVFLLLPNVPHGGPPMDGDY